MKKSLLLLLVAMSVCLSGFAQKGRQAVGVDVPFRINDNGKSSLGIGLKYQYNINDYICLEPIIQTSFIPMEEEKMNFLALLNSKFFFKRPSRFRLYGLVGLGLGVAEVCDPADDNYNECGCVFRLGLGFDYRLSYNWSWQLDYSAEGLGTEASQSYNCISTGITYNF